MFFYSFVLSLLVLSNALPDLSQIRRPLPSPQRPHVVPGRAFDRLAIIWLENADLNTALQDPNLGAIAQLGISMVNYFALTHPSEPNYAASVGGDYFGMDNDNFNMIPGNISTIVDLLEDKGISWAEYQEDMPFSGFPGFQQLNAQGKNDYVRKHNPLILFDSVQNITSRADKIKNFTLFQQDLENNALPQWMFITPNMTDDGHDTNVTFAGKFTARFLLPLLQNPNFNNNRTAILLTYDESGGNANGNRIYSVLLGNAIPASLRNTTDSNFYNHYSSMSTIQANWGLHHLGRYDAAANVYAFVSRLTGDPIRKLSASALAGVALNTSFPGLFNSKVKAPLPIPNTELVVNGRTILPLVRDIWGRQALQKCTVYSDALIPNSGLNPPVLPSGC